MGIKRRDFLRMAGVGATLGIGGKTLYEIVRGDDVLASTHHETHEGTRWAMVVDTRKCVDHPDCTDCVNVCHAHHNVPHFEDPRRVVKWIWRHEFKGAFPEQNHMFMGDEVTGKTVPVLCNHCDNPPCVKVCPTQATFKRDDGLVAMDMHRCIGCRYCIGACPYGSRSFNWQDPRNGLDRQDPDYPTRTKGVVEKCNFCAEIIAKNPDNPVPLCVKACKYEALTFGNLGDENSPVRKALKGVYTIRRKQGLGTGPSVFYIV